MLVTVCGSLLKSSPHLSGNVAQCYPNGYEQRGDGISEFGSGLLCFMFPGYVLLRIMIITYITVIVFTNKCVEIKIATGDTGSRTE